MVDVRAKRSRAKYWEPYSRERASVKRCDIREGYMYTKQIDPDKYTLLGWWNGRHVRFRCVCPMGVWVQVPSRAPVRKIQDARLWIQDYRNVLLFWIFNLKFCISKIRPGDGMVDMTVLEAVAARCRSSSLLLGTIEKTKPCPKDRDYFYRVLKLGLEPELIPMSLLLDTRLHL